MHVDLPVALKQRIHAHLQEAYPNEGGGFLLGIRAQDGVQVVDIQPVENVFAEEEQHHRYAMTPADWMRLEDEADARGLTLVGYYHSHPDSPAVPSEYDRVHALPNFTYIIMQVQTGQAIDTRAWLLDDDRSRFHELTVRTPVA
ncbi:MAG: M67 family metallopeptidase [Anaerolineae bacterium]